MSAMNLHRATRVGLISPVLHLIRVLAVASLAALASCGGQSSDSDGSPDPDEEFGDFTRAERYYLSHEIPFRGEGLTKRFEVLQPLFEANDLHAIKRYAMAYRDGMGVPRDSNKAFALYSRAAEMGDAESMGALGAMYYSGWGAPQNYDKSLAWYRKSYDLAQYAGAARGIRKFYWEGRGPGSLEENRRIAREWDGKVRLAEKEEHKNDGVKLVNVHHQYAINNRIRKAEEVLRRYHEDDFEAIESRAAGQERDAESLARLGTIRLGTDDYWKATIYQSEVFDPVEGIALLEQAYEFETRPKQRYSLAKTIERAYGTSGPKEIRSAAKARFWRSKAESR